MMFKLRDEMIPILAIALSFLIAVAAYPHLPERIPVHWNAAGEVDRYGPTLSIFALPVIMLALYLVISVLPFIDPLRKNYNRFYMEFIQLKLAFLVLLFYIFSLSLLSARGNYVSMSDGIILSISMLFFFIGTIMPGFKRNYFVGIRTPWTLASDFVWDRTHAFGGKVFMFMGALGLLALFFKQHAILVFFVPMILGIAAVIVHSYLTFRKTEGKFGRKR
ncbi:MAG: DUF1648 domain-containing protein [Candidatus Micrarchaeota archaeon]